MQKLSIHQRNTVYIMDMNDCDVIYMPHWEIITTEILRIWGEKKNKAFVGSVESAS